MELNKFNETNEEYRSRESYSNKLVNLKIGSTLYERIQRIKDIFGAHAFNEPIRQFLKNVLVPKFEMDIENEKKKKSSS